MTSRSRCSWIRVCIRWIRTERWDKVLKRVWEIGYGVRGHGKEAQRRAARLLLFCFCLFFSFLQNTFMSVRIREIPSQCCHYVFNVALVLYFCLEGIGAQKGGEGELDLVGVHTFLYVCAYTQVPGWVRTGKFSPHNEGHYDARWERGGIKRKAGLYEAFPGRPFLNECFVRICSCGRGIAL